MANKTEKLLLRESELNPGKTIVGEYQVLKMAAGYYIGRLCYEDGCPIPYDRASGYFATEEEAEKILMAEDSSIQEMLDDYGPFIDSDDENAAIEDILSNKKEESPMVIVEVLEDRIVFHHNILNKDMPVLTHWFKDISEIREIHPKAGSGSITHMTIEMETKQDGVCTYTIFMDKYRELMSAYVAYRNRPRKGESDDG